MAVTSSIITTRTYSFNFSSFSSSERKDKRFHRRSGPPQCRYIRACVALWLARWTDVPSVRGWALWVFLFRCLWYVSGSSCLPLSLCLVCVWQEIDSSYQESCDFRLSSLNENSGESREGGRGGSGGGGGLGLGSLSSFLPDMLQAIPGIDEALSFAELLQ